MIRISSLSCFPSLSSPLPLTSSFLPIISRDILSSLHGQIISYGASSFASFSSSSSSPSLSSCLSFSFCPFSTSFHRYTHSLNQATSSSSSPTITQVSSQSPSSSPFPSPSSSSFHNPNLPSPSSDPSYHIGYSYFIGTPSHPKNYSLSLSHLTTSALTHQNPSAYHLLGVMSMAGYGCQRSPLHAVKMFYFSFQKGRKDSGTQLGNLLLRGAEKMLIQDINNIDNVDREENKSIYEDITHADHGAFYYISHAALHGNCARANFQMAEKSLKENNISLAFSFSKKSAERGNKDGALLAFRIMENYHKGKETKESHIHHENNDDVSLSLSTPSDCLIYLQMAADLRHPVAERLLGSHLLYTNNNNNNNNNMGKVLLESAMNNGDIIASEILAFHSISSQAENILNPSYSSSTSLPHSSLLSLLSTSSEGGLPSSTLLLSAMAMRSKHEKSEETARNLMEKFINYVVNVVDKKGGMLSSEEVTIMIGEREPIPHWRSKETNQMIPVGITIHLMKYKMRPVLVSDMMEEYYQRNGRNWGGDVGEILHFIDKTEREKKEKK